MLVESGGTVGDFVAPQPVSPAAIPRTAGSFGEVWQLVTAPGTLRFEVPASSAARRRLALQLTTLPPGANVILSCAALGSRGRSRRLAREAGIELLREYVAIPSIDPPTCYVEDTSALRYLFTQLLTLPRGGGALSASLEAIKRVAHSFFPADLVGSLAPIRITLGRIPTSPTILATAQDHAGAKAMLDLPGKETLVVALSKDPNAKLTVLLIPRGSPRPTLAIKIPTTPAAAATIAAERRVLSALHLRLPDTIRASVPRLEDFPEAPPDPLLVTTALPGSPMTTRYHAWRHLATPAAVRADFQAVEAWLASFQGATAGPREPVDMDGGVAEVLRRRFADDPGLSKALAALGVIYARLRTTSTPRTAVHGDFWFGNLLLVGDQISGVIDWEAATACGEPVRDLVRFALTYSLYLDRHSRAGHGVAGHRGLRAGEWGSGVKWALDGTGWFPDLTREFVRSGLARLGADPDRWREAMLAGVAEVAATADHLEFARQHWRLFERLTEPAATP
ncbi:MAG TPA: phosphotransferase [Verrucomicrobiae bacterium]|nr:phosphotransferase [Verrucomicrobiae bacterium]